ncbi:pantoate--beta-alanine ligase [Paraclostridium bifermentans]|uniref:pantoate--beta-alanine ligase n=1 Tax=Paraclostridium bifermentans TaxID=1490 RepID=UPI00359C58E9
MKIIKNIDEMKTHVKAWKNEGLSIGLVPTMGYLHDGHESLIRKSKNQNDKVVVSIFVNPTQFGENEDLSTYPRDIGRDSEICENLNVDIVFTPSSEEIYGERFSTFIEVKDLSKELCGKSRPIHFRGVCTIVNKLFNIITPDKAYFGEKDAQQLAIIKRMVKDLNIDIDIIGCPIVREADGLAKSSRNSYLTEKERIAARILNESLKEAKDMILSGELSSEYIIHCISNKIKAEPLAKIDYINIVNGESMEPVNIVENNTLIAIAVFIGNTRLIDNFTYSSNKKENILCY